MDTKKDFTRAELREMAVALGDAAIMYQKAGMPLLFAQAWAFRARVLELAKGEE